MPRDMTLPDHLRATLKLGLPLIGGQIAQALIGVTDTVMAGWYGVDELAAVALGSSYYHVVLIAGMGFALAVTPLAAMAVTKGDKASARRATRMGLWLALVFGLLVLPLFIWSEAILLRLWQPELLAALTQDYLLIAGIGIWPGVLLLVLRSHLSALERTAMVLWAWLGGLLLNAFLNWVLIFGNLGAPELGVKGAAIASVGCQTLIFVILALYSARAKGLAEYTLFQRFWRPDWLALRDVIRLGFPISASLLAEVGLFMATMILMGWIGTLELAAHGIALQITSATFMIHVGFSSAATVRAGQAAANDDPENLNRAAIAVGLLSLAAVLLTMIAFVFAGGLLVGLFIDPLEPLRGELIAIGSSLLIVAAFFQLADAAQVIAMGLLRGLKDTAKPMLIAVGSYWAVGIPAAWLLGIRMEFEGEGIWFGLLIGLTIAATALITRFRVKMRRLRLNIRIRLLDPNASPPRSKRAIGD